MTIDKEIEMDMLSEAKILLESKGYKVVKVQELRNKNPYQELLDKVLKTELYNVKDPTKEFAKIMVKLLSDGYKTACENLEKFEEQK